MNRIGANRLPLPLVALLVLVLCSPVMLAQTSSLTGTVTDPGGGVVPGIEVTLISSTGLERVTITDDEGRYVFLQVNPGTYVVRAELTGFKTTEVQDVVVAVDTPALLDLQLELGEVTEVVTVSSTSLSVVNRIDAAIGNNFNQSQIVDLPLESRNVVNLLSLQPGVDAQGQVTGARSDQSNLTLDGVDVNEQQTGTAFTPVLRVTPDSVQEFKVTVSNAGASQGRSSGGQVSLITKSGTNDWHGSAYWFHRNTVTSANDFFNNRVGVDTPVLLRNLFGGSIGGPIKKDRAFFFFNYEGRIDRSQSSTVRTVPLAHLGQGAVRYQTVDGTEFELSPDEIARLYPATGGVNPVALAFFADQANSFPANDTTSGDGINTGGYRFNDSTPLDQNTWIARVDLNVTDKHTVYVRGNYQWDNQQFTSAGAPLLPYLPGEPHPVSGVIRLAWRLVIRGQPRQRWSTLSGTAIRDRPSPPAETLETTVSTSERFGSRQLIRGL